MSPIFTPARTLPTPAIAGRTPLAAGGIAATSIATIITTGTGTIGHRWASVRE